MSRANHTTPSVNAGCGYKANVSSGKVTIYPTVNNSGCYKIHLGLGDATFTFDARNPPDTIKRVLTKDADGTYTPQIVSTPKRSVKLFDSVETINETFTDADDNTTEVTMPKLIGFSEDAYTAGRYVATGVATVARASGRTTNAQVQVGMFQGSVPFNIQIDAIQLAMLRNGYAWIDNDGFLNIRYIDSITTIRFNMGDGVTDKFITEFTVKNDNVTFICRNGNNIATEVYAPFSYGNYYKNSGVYHQHIIRVAGGTMLKQGKDGAIFKSVLLDDGTAIPLGENDVIDLITNGEGGIEEIKLSDSSSKVIRKVGNYTLKDDNKLYNGNTEIAENIFGLGKASREHLKGLALGKAGNVSNAVKSTALNIFTNAGVQQSWNDEYLNWYSKQTLPSCEWAGIGETHTTTTTFGNCITKSSNKNNGVGYAVVAIDGNGQTYIVNENTLIEQVEVSKDADGFKAIYELNNSGKLISFNNDNEESLLKMPDIEISFSNQTEFFKL